MDDSVGQSGVQVGQVDAAVRTGGVAGFFGVNGESKVKNTKVGQGKPYTIFSENPKMDTSGMAGKPITYDLIIEYEPPTMPLSMMIASSPQGKSKK
jgi:hypothetical protein